MSINKSLASTISSISGLQGTCNNLERRLKAKLTKLDVGTDPDGKKVTEATFEPFTGPRTELGKAVITAGGDGTNMAYILTVATKVQISRS
jgi:hypothetical protein